MHLICTPPIGNEAELIIHRFIQYADEELFGEKKK